MAPRILLERRFERNSEFAEEAKVLSVSVSRMMTLIFWVSVRLRI